MHAATQAKDPPPYWIIILARGADSGMSRGLILALSPRTALSLDSPRMHIPGASAAVLCGRPISTQSLPCGYRETTQMRVWREFTQRCPGMSSVRKASCQCSTCHFVSFTCRFARGQTVEPCGLCSSPDCGIFFDALGALRCCYATIIAWPRVVSSGV